MITLTDYCKGIDYNAVNIELEALEIEQLFDYSEQRQERINELYSVMEALYL